MENLNVNQEMNFDEMANVVGGGPSGLNGGQCDEVFAFTEELHDLADAALDSGNGYLFGAYAMLAKDAGQVWMKECAS
ncbi:MAG: hypothetical protein ACJAWV_003250 [Flammeovirgaceae bacterium]|jgi:hypothetical protein